MNVSVSGFERGTRIAMPADVSGGCIEYFIPSSLAELRVSNDAASGEAASSGTPVLHTPGAWMLTRSRREEDEGGVDIAASESTRLAISRLTDSPLTHRAIVDAGALLLAKPAATLFRDAIAWVNGASPARAKLVPPPSSAVAGLLRDLAAFAARADIAPWIRQALSYYQFIHIHPFADGNGRYSRVLVAALGGAGAHGRHRALMVATALTFHRKAFVSHFGEMQDGRLDGYLARWSALHRWSGDCAHRLALRERSLRTQLSEVVVSSTRGSELFGALASLSSFTERHLADRLNWSAKTAPIHLARLHDAGWIRAAPQGSQLRFSPPIADARSGLLREIRTETDSLLR